VTAWEIGAEWHCDPVRVSRSGDGASLAASFATCAFAGRRLLCRYHSGARATVPVPLLLSSGDSGNQYRSGRGSMADLSNYQRKVVDRYYNNRDAIMLTKLQELVTEIFLAETDKKRETLWQRVEKAMTQLKVPAPIMQHIMEKRDAQILASNVQDWLKQATGR